MSEFRATEYRVVRLRKDRETGRPYWANVTKWDTDVSRVEAVFARVCQHSPNTHYRLIAQNVVKERIPNAASV